MQKDLLASKLVESNPDLLETARLNSTKLYNTVIAQEELALTQKDLCNTVKCQLCKAVRPIRPKLENQLYRTARPELEDIVAGSESINLLEAELCDAARATRRVNA